MHPIASTRPSSDSSPRDLHDDATCTTHRLSSVSFEANWETLAQLASRRSKPLDLNACLAPSSSSRWFCGATETIAHLVLRPKPINRQGDFVGQITKLQLLILRPKSENSTTLVLRPNQETRTPHLLVHGIDRTRCHPNSRLAGHRLPDLCLTIPGPLHQVSYSCLDPRCCPSCRTCYLHTT
jgi:hypothetical protein